MKSLFQKKKFDETNNRRSTNRILYRNEGSEEQYEGGRAGNRRDEREYRDTDDDYRRDNDAETAKIATKLVQDELKRRAAVIYQCEAQQKLDNSNTILFFQAIENKPKTWTAASVNCPLMDPSNRKIPNVTIQLREHVCRKLKESLMDNIEKCFSHDETQRITQ